MSLWLLTNTASRDCTEIVVSFLPPHSPVTDVEAAGIDVIRGGPRHLSWTQSGTGTRFVGYVNRSTPMTATHAVIVNADIHDDNFGEVVAYSDYPTSITVVDAYIAGECGIDGRDCVRELPITSGWEAVGLRLTGGSYTKTLHQVYFCQGLEFKHRQGTLHFEPVPVWQRAEEFGGNFYKLQARTRFSVGPISRDDAEAYQALPKHDPVFFYDDTGGEDYGNFLPHKLWHCVILGDTLTTMYADDESELVFIDFDIGILRYGNG